MTRSIWKGPYIAPCFFRQKYTKKKASTSSLDVFSRGSVIMPQMVGSKFGIHNGYQLFVVVIKEEMVGHKFGEFSFTKKTPIHKKKTKTK